MKYFLLIFISLNLYAQDPVLSSSAVDVEKFCSGPTVEIDGVNFVVQDEGFCDALTKLKEENETVDAQFVQDIIVSLDAVETLTDQTDFCLINEADLQQLNTPSVYDRALTLGPDQDRWKLRFYASHSFTTYFDTDMRMRSSRINVDIQDYSWTERSSREFFTPSTWKEEGNNPFQMIDEPTNTFTFSLEKNGNEFFLSAFHPKFLQNDQTRQVSGTIDGVEVNGVQPINKPFDGYDQVPGEMELVRNQNTHQEMIFEVGYGHRFKLLEGRLGSLVYTPSVGVGVTVGANYSVIVKEGAWWEFDDYTDRLKVQGFGGSISNRLEYNTPNKKFGVFYENKLGFYKQNHGFLDGTQEYDLKFMGNNVGVVFMLYNPKKKNIPKN